MFSKEVISLLENAKDIVKQSSKNPSSDIVKDLVKLNISEKKHDVYSSNILKFFRSVLGTHKGSEFYICETNTLINLMESCDVISNCKSFIPEKAVVLSNVKELNSYRKGKVDLVLLSSNVISRDSVVLDKTSKSMFSFAKSNNIPVYVVSSILGIDVHSMFKAEVCITNSLFDGIISEYGCTKFDSFISSAQKSCSWLFF